MAERPEDLNLPTSIVTKIIKDCLPNTCKVSKEANAAIAKVNNEEGIRKRKQSTTKMGI